jgi:hypothetical protein
LLVSRGFTLDAALLLPEVGVEIDRVATAPSGRSVWFEYKGSVQGSRPGLMRTDTLKKAVANGALLQRLVERPPYVVLTSHLPASGAGLAMLQTALELQYFDDVICVYDPSQTGRLGAL